MIIVLPIRKVSIFSKQWYNDKFSHLKRKILYADSSTGGGKCPVMNVHQWTKSSTTEFSIEGPHSMRSLCCLHSPLYFITRLPPCAVYFACSEFAHVKMVWCEKHTVTHVRQLAPADDGMSLVPRQHAKIEPALVHHKDSELQNASHYCTHANSKIQLHISFVLAGLSLWNIVYCLHAAWATMVFARYAKLGRVSNTGWSELPEPLISVLYCYKQFKEYIRDSRCSVCSRFEHCLYTPTSVMRAGGSHHDPKRVSKSKLLFGTVSHYSKLTLHQRQTTRGAPISVCGPQEFSDQNAYFPTKNTNHFFFLVIWWTLQA